MVLNIYCLRSWMFLFKVKNIIWRTYTVFLEKNQEKKYQFDSGLLNYNNETALNCRLPVTGTDFLSEPFVQNFNDFFGLFGVGNVEF